MVTKSRNAKTIARQRAATADATIRAMSKARGGEGSTSGSRNDTNAPRATCAAERRTIARPHDAL